VSRRGSGDIILNSGALRGSGDSHLTPRPSLRAGFVPGTCREKGSGINDCIAELEALTTLFPFFTPWAIVVSHGSNVASVSFSAYALGLTVIVTKNGNVLRNPDEMTAIGRVQFEHIERFSHHALVKFSQILL
jgi:hypothetical protein